MMIDHTDNKYDNLFKINTPIKTIVENDINSWLETNIKNNMIYKYKNHHKLKNIKSNNNIE